MLLKNELVQCTSHIFSLNVVVGLETWCYEGPFLDGVFGLALALHLKNLNKYKKAYCPIQRQRQKYNFYITFFFVTD